MVYKIGQRVRVSLPDNEVTIIGAIRPYHDREAVVSGSHHYPGGRTYNLAGVYGRNHQPYEFLAEWLTPIEEGEEQ